MWLEARFWDLRSIEAIQSGETVVIMLGPGGEVEEVWRGVVQKCCRACEIISNLKIEEDRAASGGCRGPHPT